MARNLPIGWECNFESCKNFDPQGSMNSCNGGSLTNCPIVSGFMTEHIQEALLVGDIALHDNDRLHATRSYFEGKRRGESKAEKVS